LPKNAPKSKAADRLRFCLRAPGRRLISIIVRW
jgi:hypothetical protein